MKWDLVAGDFFFFKSRRKKERRMWSMSCDCRHMAPLKNRSWILMFVAQVLQVFNCRTVRLVCLPLFSHFTLALHSFLLVPPSDKLSWVFITFWTFALEVLRHSYLHVEMNKTKSSKRGTEIKRLVRIGRLIILNPLGPPPLPCGHRFRSRQISSNNLLFRVRVSTCGCEKELPRNIGIHSTFSSVIFSEEDCDALAK